MPGKIELGRMPKAIYERSKSVLVKEEAEGFVLFNTASEELHTLNSSAGHVFKLCDGMRGAQEIAEAMRERFALPTPPLDDVQNCLKELLKKGLIAPRGVLSKRPTDARSARGNRFEALSNGGFKSEVVVRRQSGERSATPIESKALPDDRSKFNDQVLQNLQASLHVHFSPILCDLHRVKPNYIPQTFNYPIFNPSVVANPANFVFLTRCTNEFVLADGDLIVKVGEHNTFNVLHYYDCSLKLRRSKVVDDSLVRRACKRASFGFEDGRIFSWNGSNWLLAAGRSDHERGAAPYSQLLLKLKDNKIVECVELKSPNKYSIEKNWIPFVKGERLFIIYSILPLIVYELGDDYSLRLLTGDPAELANSSVKIRGGTQFISWKGAYLSVAHDPAVELTKKRYYTHRFVVIDENFRLREISEPFFIQRKGIEFAAGLAKISGRILLSYGVADRASAFVTLSERMLSKWLLTAWNGSHRLASR